MSTAEIPSHLLDLLERPNYGVLATVGHDDSAQSSPMWFEFADGTIRFTHTTGRAKYRNLQRNPSMSLTVYDPENPLRYIELRGRLVSADPDPTASEYHRLNERYGNLLTIPDTGHEDRVILVMSIDKVIGR